MSATKEFADRLLAKLYGFPQCCVDFYVSASTDERRRAIGAGGLRLCPSCSSKTLEQVVMVISERRICPQPFPISPKQDDFRTIIEDQRFTEKERVWMLANKKRVIPDVDPFVATLLALHVGLKELEEHSAANIAAEPNRENWFRAEHELAKSRLLSVVLSSMHGAMQKQVIQQVQSGHLKI